MTIKTLDANLIHRVRGELQEPGLEHGLEFVPSVDVFQLWNPNLLAEPTNADAEEDDNTISIFDAIGAGFFSEGVTAKRIDAALRRIGKRDVVVNINSPGGLMFEGITIYNLLKNHRGSVRVNVLGIAASAASVIAMAGDEIVMNRGSQVMVHNPMACMCGDYRDMADAVRILTGFRDSALEIYEGKTGLSASKLRKMLDDETFMTAQQAVDNGFATAVEDVPTREENRDGKRVTTRAKAMGTLKVALAREGLTRKQRSAIFQELGLVASMTDEAHVAASMTGAPEEDTGAQELLAAIFDLTSTFKKGL